MVYILYIALSAVSVICAAAGVRKNKLGLMKAYAIFAIAAGVALAVGLYDPTKSTSGTVVYVSGSGGTGGMKLESLLSIFLYMLPPMLIGGIAAAIAGKR